MSDISGDRASGSSDYTLANKSLTVDTTNDIVVFDADDFSISSATFTSDLIAFYKETGVEATSPIICYIDITTLLLVGGTGTIEWNSTGIYSY